MRKVLRILVLVLVTALVVIQFFQPERNTGREDGEQDIMEVLDIPDDISVLLKTSCYDCHSNVTEYPWYSRIAPVSWYLGSHISEGKDELNFSEFGSLRPVSRAGAFSDISEVVESGAMPLKSYLLIHRDSRLGPEERKALSDWAKTEMELLLKK